MITHKMKFVFPYIRKHFAFSLSHKSFFFFQGTFFFHYGHVSNAVKTLIW